MPGNQKNSSTKATITTPTSQVFTPHPIGVRQKLPDRFHTCNLPPGSTCTCGTHNKIHNPDPVTLELSQFQALLAADMRLRTRWFHFMYRLVKQQAVSFMTRNILSREQTYQYLISVALTNYMTLLRYCLQSQFSLNDIVRNRYYLTHDVVSDYLSFNHNNIHTLQGESWLLFAPQPGPQSKLLADIPFESHPFKVGIPGPEIWDINNFLYNFEIQLGVDANNQQLQICEQLLNHLLHNNSYGWWITKKHLHGWLSNLISYAYSVSSDIYHKYHVLHHQSMNPVEYWTRFTVVITEMVYNTVVNYFLILETAVSYQRTYNLRDVIKFAYQESKRGKESTNRVGLNQDLIQELVTIRNQVEEGNVQNDQKVPIYDIHNIMLYYYTHKPGEIPDDIYIDEEYQPSPQVHSQLIFPDKDDVLHMQELTDLMPKLIDAKKGKPRIDINVNITDRDDDTILHKAHGTKTNIQPRIDGKRVADVTKIRSRRCEDPLLDNVDLSLKPLEEYENTFKSLIKTAIESDVFAQMLDKNENGFDKLVYQPYVQFSIKVIHHYYTTDPHITSLFATPLDFRMRLPGGGYRNDDLFVMSIIKSLIELFLYLVCKWLLLKKSTNKDLSFLDMMVEDYQMMAFLDEKMSRELNRYAFSTHHYDTEVFREAGYIEAKMFCTGDGVIDPERDAQEEENVNFWESLLDTFSKDVQDHDCFSGASTEPNEPNEPNVSNNSGQATEYANLSTIDDGVKKKPQQTFRKFGSKKKNKSKKK